MAKMTKSSRVKQSEIERSWWSRFLGSARNDNVVVFVIIILVGIYIYGYQQMFFHQDDLDWFILANQPFWGVMSAPIGDHVNFVWRLLLKAEWELFGLYFPLYLAVSVILHGGVIWCLYKLAKLSSGRSDLAAVAAILFTINTNWTETVLWISGQTITITVLFVLLGMQAIWKKRGETIWLLLASMTSSLAVGLLAGAGVVYRRGLIPLVGVLILFFFVASDGTAVEFGWEWVMRVVSVAGGMTINAVIGRFFVPFDRFEGVRIVGVGVLLVYGAWRWRGQLREVWQDQWSRFLIVQIVIYNLVVALGRAQYGIGIMRAERYTYLGLALFLLLVVRVLRNWQIGKWIWIVPVLVLMQGVGFYTRARMYVVRPQQMKQLFVEINEQGRENIKLDQYLPHFVLNDERLKYQDLMNLIND